MTLDRADAFISETIRWETAGDRTGAYTNDPHDSGGETKWGISKNAHPDLDIKELTYKQAVEIYKKEYYNPLFNLIMSENIAFKVFDMGVLSGQRTSIKMLQQTIRDLGGLTIAKDGMLGPLTLTAMHMVIGKVGETKFLNQLMLNFVRRAERIVLFKPWNRKYLKGWMNRIVFLFKDPDLKEGVVNEKS